MRWNFVTQNLLTGKCAIKIVKLWENRKKQILRDFSTLSIDDMKTKKKHKSVLLV